MIMPSHSKVRSLLYEYLRNELSGEDRSFVEEHLASCRRCSGRLRSLQEVFHCVPPTNVRPSDGRPELFWQHFADHVERRISDAGVKKRTPLGAWVDELASLMFYRRRFVAVFSGAIAVLAVAVVLWQAGGPERPAPGPEGALGKNEAQIEPVSDRMRQYFQKSKVLLVGITNMTADEAQGTDLTLERGRSRELIQEARYLKYQGIDRRSARLIGDMEKILIELANMKEQGEVPGVEMIRTGIHRENLLFKIRMAEAMYDTARFMNVNDSN